MRKTVFALLLALPLMAACTTNTVVNPQPASSPTANPTAAPTAAATAPPSTTPVVAPSGAPGQGGISTGAVTTDATTKYAGFVFTPNTITIKAGQSVGFYNGMQNSMRVTSNDGAVDSGSLEFSQGSTYVQVFSKTGTYVVKNQTQTSAFVTITVQ
jgi:plastocyanin